MGRGEGQKSERRTVRERATDETKARLGFRSVRVVATVASSASDSSKPGLRDDCCSSTNPALSDFCWQLSQ
eukprot:scaffold629214_cov45-Prasinocladus_malaysianus.AAC.1